MRNRPRSPFSYIAPAALAATAIGLTVLGTPAVASMAVLFQSNVPIITVPPVTTPPVGVPGTTESPVPVNPNPGPPDEGTIETAPKGAAMKMKQEGGEKLYVYLVLQSRYKKDAKVENTMPGVVGKPWRAVTSMEKKPFHFPLTSVAAGSEYYVVGMRKVKGKLIYHSKYPVRVERQ